MDENEEKRINSLFAVFSDEYDEHMSRTNHTNVQFEIMACFSDQLGGRVLDIATGTGVIAKWVKENIGSEVHAIDNCPAMISKAKDVRGVHFRVGDVTRLPYPEDYFDAVTCSYGFYWFKDRKKAMLEIKRVLKPDGRFILLEEEFNKGDPKPRFSKYKEDYLKELAGLEEYVGVAHLKDLSAEVGLKLIKELSIPIDEFHRTVGMVFENSENHACWDNRLHSEPSR